MQPWLIHTYLVLGITTLLIAAVLINSPSIHITIMVRGPELSPQMRSRICELHSLRYSYNAIYRKHPELKRSTIISTIRLEASRVDNTSKPRSGARRKISEEQRDRVYDIVNFQDPHIKHRDLLREIDDVIKIRSIQKLL